MRLMKDLLGLMHLFGLSMQRVRSTAVRIMRDSGKRRRAADQAQLTVMKRRRHQRGDTYEVSYIETKHPSIKPGTAKPLGIDASDISCDAMFNASLSAF